MQVFSTCFFAVKISQSSTISQEYQERLSEISNFVNIWYEKKITEHKTESN